MVNSNDKPAILVLMAYDPVIWNVSYSDKTHILGVLLGGYEPQNVEGISNSTQVLRGVKTEDSECPVFYSYDRASDEKKSNMEIIVKSITGKKPEKITYYAKNDIFYLP